MAAQSAATSEPVELVDSVTDSQEVAQASDLWSTVEEVGQLVQQAVTTRQAQMAGTGATSDPWAAVLAGTM